MELIRIYLSHIFIALIISTILYKDYVPSHTSLIHVELKVNQDNCIKFWECREKDRNKQTKSIFIHSRNKPAIGWP